MRLLDGLPAEEVRAALRNGLTRGLDGSPMYDANVSGVTIQRLSRRIDVGGGMIEHI